MSPNDSCKLVSREWNVTQDGDELNQVKVNGPGVIGLFPVVTPLSKFQYCSQTEYNSPRGGTMDGYFTMRFLNRPETFQLRIAPCKMSISLRTATR